MNNIINEIDTKSNIIINILKSKIIIIIVYILNIIKYNYEKFLVFLISNNIIQLAIGIILGTQIGNFTNSLNSILLTPIIKYIDERNNNLNSFDYNLFGIKIKYGELILCFIQLFTSMLIIYLLWYLTSMSDFKIFDKQLQSLFLILGVGENMGTN